MTRSFQEAETSYDRHDSRSRQGCALRDDTMRCALRDDTIGVHSCGVTWGA